MQTQLTFKKKFWNKLLLELDFSNESVGNQRGNAFCQAKNDICVDHLFAQFSASIDWLASIGKHL